jgi:WD40 repeat protein
MKIRLLLCCIFSFVSACSGVPGITPTLSSTATEVAQPVSSPTTLPEPTVVPTATAAASGCTPLLTPAAFFPDGERLLGFKDNSTYIYNLKTHTLENPIQTPARVIIAALSPDGKTIALGLEDFSILLVSASDQKVLHTLTAHTGIISGLAFSPSGDRLLTSSEDTWVRIWTLDGQEVAAFQPSGADNFPSQVMGMGVSSDWRMLATIPFVGWMNLWSMPEHNLIGTFEGVIEGGYSGSAATFSPDSQYLAQHLGAGGGYLSLWRIANGKLLLRGQNITTGVTFSPDGRYLAYGEMLPEAGGGHMVVRAPDGGQLIYDLKDDVGSLPGAPVFTPDGSLLVAVDYASGNLLGWLMADGQPVVFGETVCTGH